MKRCTQTDKLVSIVIAVYKPNEKWFSQLLESIENQTYGNIDVFIYDDCPDEPFDKSLVKLIKSYDTKIISGEKNIGSNLAFEYLTRIADGEYIAYCDQDDIWREDKIERLVEKFSLNPKTTLVCSDMNIIDADGKKLFDSYRQVSKRHIFYEGEDVYKRLIMRNFAVGCTVMIDSVTAKKALSFVSGFYHDHWLTLCASVSGNIGFVNEGLIYYRIHGGNQTGVFSGIDTKQDYFEKRIMVFYNRNMNLGNRLSELCSGEKRKAVEKTVEETKKYAILRKEHYTATSLSTFLGMLKCFKFGTFVNLFEIFLPFMPETVFKKAIGLIKSNKI